MLRWNEVVKGKETNPSVQGQYCRWMGYLLADIYFFKINNGKTRTMCGSVQSNKDNDGIDVVLVFSFLTLNEWNHLVLLAGLEK